MNVNKAQHLQAIRYSKPIFDEDSTILKDGYSRTAGDQFGSPNQTIIRNLQNDFSQGSNKIKK